LGYHAAMADQDGERLRVAYEDRVRSLESDVAARQRELKILSEVASKVHGEDEVQAILDIALEEILGRLGLHTAWIFIGDEREQKLDLVASRGVSPIYLEEIERNGLGECLCPEVFWSGHRMQARNTTQCPRMPTIVEGLAEPVAHACIPLRFEKGSRGVLNVANRPGRLFTEDELRFLETLGHQIGLAVERARHLHAERVRNQEARAMAAITKAIGGSLDIPSILRAVVKTALDLLSAERAYILLGSDPRRITVAQLGGPLHPELREGHVLDLAALDARLHRRCLLERVTIRIDDSSRDPRANRALAERWQTPSALLVPFVAHDETLGLLAVTAAHPRRWADEHVEVAEALAAQAAVAVENARLYEEARAALHELRNAQARIIHNEKMAVLGTFASGLAHEVRNPLNSISLQLSVLERRIGRCEAGLAGEMAELVDVIREEIRRLEILVEDFLLFSRTDHIQYRPARLEDIVGEVLNLMALEAQASAVEMRYQADGPVPWMRMDAEKMKQVVINLVRNAIEAMPAGGTVEVRTGMSDGRAQLVVSDTGPGLPSDVDVFQLFVTTKPKGTGLGLSIVQQIVLQHGGEIFAGRAPAGGARFTIALPALPAEDPVASQEAVT
jgi:signal transduction histidine kinase